MEASFLSQTIVYFNKIKRIAIKERFWKFILFSIIISLIVSTVVGGNMFTDYETTKSGFFSIVSAAIWIGIFNSIQSICKEHEVIRSEYRSGMKIASYITAHAAWQFVICLAQSVVILSVSYIFIDYNTEGIIVPVAAIEYFITILLVTFGSDVMGIMISSIARTPTTAMTIMPFILIIQLIMSGVLFDLGNWSEKISYITFSKWGMSAFGSIADLNSDLFPLRLSSIYPNVIKMEMEKAYTHSSSNLLNAWICLLAITIVCYIVSILSIKIMNRHT